MELGAQIKALRLRRRVTQEELAILASDWSTAAGEQVDQHRREIARLRERAGRS